MKFTVEKNKGHWQVNGLPCRKWGYIEYKLFNEFILWNLKA